jgi:hypothetical protein
MDRFKAPGTELVEFALIRSTQSDVLHLLVMTAVLYNEVGAPSDGQRAHLRDVRGVLKHAGRDGFIEEERFFLELQGSDEHRREL